MRTALITLTIGEYFRKLAELVHPYMNRYAQKIGAQFLPIPDSKYQHCHFDKFIIGDLLKIYDRIIYLDMDILIGPNCPNLFDIVDDDKIGMLHEGKYATEDERQIHHQIMLKASTEYGIPIPDTYDFCNAGVMVVSRCHKDIYQPPKKIVFMEYGDQPLVNLRIAHSGFRTQDIGPDMNRMPYLDRLGKPRTDAHIIHYAGISNPHDIIGRDIPLVYPQTSPEMRTIMSRIEMLDILELSGKKCVEVGVFKAGYSQEIIKRNPSELWLIDPFVNQADDIWPDDYVNRPDREDLRECYYNTIHMFLHDPRVRILREFSINAAPAFKDNSIDFVYIDAVHTFESTLCDMTTWWPKVKSGGWLCGHDYTGTFPGVKLAVDAFARLVQRPLSLLCLEYWASWGIQKS